MKNLKYITFLFLAVFAISCEDVVTADLNTAPPKLVIDASIDWEKGTDGSVQKVKLTTTAGFYDTQVPVVSNATVEVANSANTIFEFIETPGTGIYICNNFVPVIGETYVLTVVTGGQTYKATETMIAAPEIGSVEQKDDGGFSGDEIQVKFFFNDNAAEANYYMTAFETNITVYPFYEVFDDEFTNGNQNFGLYSNEDLVSGNQMKFALYGISEKYMNYMNIILESSGGSGPWSSTPTNVRGNIINQTYFNNFALGYFRVCEVDKMNYTVR